MIECTRHGEDAAVRIHGRFDFAIYTQFRKLFARCADMPGRLTIDLSSVDYMDSAALGMLLLLEERLPPAHPRVLLFVPHGQPRQVLEVAGFDRYFDFSSHEPPPPHEALTGLASLTKSRTR